MTYQFDHFIDNCKRDTQKIAKLTYEMISYLSNRKANCFLLLFLLFTFDYLLLSFTIFTPTKSYAKNLVKLPHRSKLKSYDIASEYLSEYSDLFTCSAMYFECKYILDLFFLYCQLYDSNFSILLYHSFSSKLCKIF